MFREYSYEKSVRGVFEGGCRTSNHKGKLYLRYSKFYDTSSLLLIVKSYQISVIIKLSMASLSW